MKATYTISLLFFSMFSLAQDDQIAYPHAPSADIKDTIWGVTVSDPYRPLETDNEARNNWLKEEKQITDNYFKKVAHKSDIEYDYIHSNRFTQNIPIRSGPYYLEYRYGMDGACIDVYYKDFLRDPPRLLYSPSMLMGKVTRFSDVKVSADGKYCALMFSGNGSDWQEIRVYNVINMSLMKDRITNVRYSGINWFQNGFFYSRFDSVDENHRYTDIEQNQKVYYHKMGTDASLDSLVFEDKDYPYNTFSIKTTDDERFVIISESYPEENRTVTFFKDYKKNKPFKALINEYNSKSTVLGSIGDTLLIESTNNGAYNGQIVEIDTKKPSLWGTLVDNQKKYQIKQAIYANNTFTVVFQQGFNEYICLFSRDGELLKTIPLPDGSDYEIICYSPDQNSIVLSKNYYICPPIGVLLSLKDFSLTYIMRQTYISFNPLNYNFFLSEYRSGDSTLVPIYIVMSIDHKKTQPGAALLSVFGGFGISPLPRFDPGILAFLDNGGIYAVANVRGGANYVKGWHESGTLLHKQNTIDDAYYAGRFLIDSGFAQAGKLAITGGSNGGFVVASVINQHPDLFKVALINVGLYDMIRYENFTSGIMYEKEYGSINDSLQFKNLLSLSPLHNIKPNTDYPSMLVTTSQYDDRVPPLHSYKYIAALQSLTHGKNPILLNVNKDQGHNATGSFDKRLETAKLFYSFLFKELNMKYQPMSFYESK